MIIRKSPAEIDQMAEAGRVVADVIALLAEQLERLDDDAAGALHLRDLHGRLADDPHQAGTCSSAD